MRGGLFSYGRLVRLWRASRRVLVAPRAGGFTVIEVMIVLAVSGALFVSAAIMISGRQNQTAFDQAVRQIQSQIQQTINDVAVGFFPDKGTFQCTAGAFGPALASGSSTQGTNSDCIFLGKAMQFKVASTEPEEFTIYTVAGLRAGAGGVSASLAEAQPMLVAPSSPNHTDAGYPDSSTTDALQNGLTTARMWYNDGLADYEIGAVAFVSSLDEFAAAGGAIKSGTGQVDAVAIKDTSLGSTRDVMVEAMNSDAGKKLMNGVVNPAGGVFICFQSATTKQFGVLQIGGAGRELSVALQIKDDKGTTCA